MVTHLRQLMYITLLIGSVNSFGKTCIVQHKIFDDGSHRLMAYCDGKPLEAVKDATIELSYDIGGVHFSWMSLDGKKLSALLELLKKTQKVKIIGCSGDAAGGPSEKAICVLSD